MKQDMTYHTTVSVSSNNLVVHMLSNRSDGRHHDRVTSNVRVPERCTKQRVVELLTDACANIDNDYIPERYRVSTSRDIGDYSISELLAELKGRFED